MADPIELAKTARSTLAEALSALQSHPDAPEELLEIAAPIAQSMGVLHRIEKSKGENLGEVPQALANVRGALDSLQQIGIEHDAVDDAMEHVAGSLAKLFALSKLAKSNKPTTPGSPRAKSNNAYTVPEPVASEPETQPKPVVGAQSATVPAARQASKPPAEKVSEPQQFTPRGTMKIDDARGIQDEVRAEVARTEAMAKREGQSGGIDMPQAKPQADAPTVPDPAALRASQAPAAIQPTIPQPAPQPQPAPAQQQVAAPAAGNAPTAPQRVPGMTDAPVPSGSAQHVDVELGAHSVSNFYKGLSGNDVVEHGGIFVQTYQIPPVGTAVALRVLLPGDLEFDADALVQWTRETRSGETDPGFGAKFTRISDVGRDLVYRYVRNREPMFYDDL